MEDQDKKKADERTIMDPEFLEDVFGKRDTVQESEDVEEVEVIKKENEMRLQEGYKELKRSLDSGKYDEAADVLEKLKYYHSLQQAIAERGER